ncbi:hypothetical protein H2200_002901 [Cladophialophora chaetospira]|uniref:Uncharacterized protein n=1 Tax=Cladophialophora chaetospira TaxID=386627 RepID=A0AA38XGC3_9EURO|nr:hypothetical protein H2200_002901 [Cladophialophora chaetospira]
MAADEFYYRNTPAVRFPYVECDLEQLQTLTRNAQDILSVLEHTKKTVAALTLLQSRLSEQRAVRCTTQSVRATAAARYASVERHFDLSSIPVNVFVDLVTYLPLLDVKTLATSADALGKITQLFSSRSLSPRWGTYYTCLTSCNQEWAKLFFDDVQRYFQDTGQGTDSLSPVNRSTQNVGAARVMDLMPRQTTSHGEVNSQPAPLPLNPQSVASSVGSALDQYQAPRRVSLEIDNANAEFAKTVEMHLRAIRAKEKAWGCSNPTTLDTVAELGGIYASRGYLVEAIEMYRRAAEGYEAANGGDHPRTQEIVRARDSIQTHLA